MPTNFFVEGSGIFEQWIFWKADVYFQWVDKWSGAETWCIRGSLVWFISISKVISLFPNVFLSISDSVICQRMTLSGGSLGFC